ncbi:DNA-sulfur modification-associated [Thermoanaerobacter thermohydrosulfuricus]|uniref:DNA-sulfur modification-associated n=1 Tax=Thermoanaerobacter thermohydrosulfuricus TaxID=1516 RepID=A0A1G7S7S9_THETY|nr:DNA sulfur modification protein DndB [Thermoanaerobacter thermohydrosulfuricus]SDG19041.1 DNA-sulfur modification-associated [Thermoanaerobacter thermohydrosulfuricus]
MKVEPRELYNSLNAMIKMYGKNNKVLEEVTNLLIKRGIPRGYAKKILMGITPVEILDRAILYVVTSAFYQVTNESIVNIEKYFTDEEIKEGEKFQYITEKKESFPVVFEDVLKVSDDYYITTLTAQKIKELYDGFVVTYNKETQRNTIARRIRNSVIEMINVNWKSVKEIEEEILKGLFITNAITFNILKNGEEEFEYDEKNRTLTVYKGEIDILDGFHRSLGMINAVSVNPEVQYITAVNITNFDIEKARRFIVQEDKKNKIAKKHIEAYKETLENIIVRKINESPNCDLKGKITTNGRLIQFNQALVEFEVLAQAIKYHFDIKTQREANQIADYLIEGFNEIIGLYPDEFLDNYAKVKQRSIINHNYTFIGYVALLAKLRESSQWKEKLRKTLEKIDFSIKNPDWEAIGLFNDRLTIKVIESISKYFTDKIVKEG